MCKRLIFLDIDGVLNSGKHFKQRVDQQNDVDDFDPEAVKNLNYIIEATHAKIVLSSTWRKTYDTVEKIQALFDKVGIKGECIGRTPVIYLAEESMCKPIFSCQRGTEIDHWIKKNMDNWNYRQYVIIDDDSDMLLKQAPNFFLTDNDVGLTPSVAYKIVNFLNSFN